MANNNSLLISVDLSKVIANSTKKMNKSETKIWNNFLEWIKTDDFIEHKFLFERGCLFQNYTTIMYMPLLERLNKKEVIQISSHLPSALVNAFTWLVHNDLQDVLKDKYKISDEIAKDIADKASIGVYSQAYASIGSVQ